ncbi:Sb-PDE family phosphodiesterase [uncultured Porphyromonas sp.]|uniref:Sb-PDE family phosphodiesterase n=1 Tax=uncultured Porphyromonas sp. TaxID=159274 RepID=UPI00262F4594|nr:Sb-PDE family phosphodiesterase [uncultured Porphyromonas sp.]
MKIRTLIVALMMCSSPLYVWAQNVEGDGMLYLQEQRRPEMRELIMIPAVGEYTVLKCDFHMHTIFSDGLVWPTIRTQEAWEEGLDALAITDHIEYHPHHDDVSTGHNRAHEIAQEDALRRDLILIRGSEITRDTPPGHFNAIFTTDNSLFSEDKSSEQDIESIRAAKAQRAFIFWNHPGWKPNIEGSYTWLPFIDQIYREGALRGIEVINGFGFHKRALDWCVDHNLTVMGTSDIHNLVRHDYDRTRGFIHRTMTLVLAKDRSADGIREGLEAGRTIAWAGKLLAGREENIRAIFDACVSISGSYHCASGKKATTNYYTISNNSDLYFELNLLSDEGTKRVVLYPRSSQILTVRAGQSSVSYEVSNTYIRSDKHLTVTFDL